MLPGSFSSLAGKQFVVPVKTVHFVIMLFAVCKVYTHCVKCNLFWGTSGTAGKDWKTNKEIGKSCLGFMLTRLFVLLVLLVPLSVFGLTVQTDVLFIWREALRCWINWPSHERLPVNLSGRAGNFQTRRPTLSWRLDTLPAERAERNIKHESALILHNQSILVEASFQQKDFVMNAVLKH